MLVCKSPTLGMPIGIAYMLGLPLAENKYIMIAPPRSNMEALESICEDSVLA